MAVGIGDDTTCDNGEIEANRAVFKTGSGRYCMIVKWPHGALHLVSRE